MSAPATIADPLASALGFVTQPYAQGAATQAVAIGPAIAGVSAVPAYSFAVFQARYGVQSGDIAVSYLLTLLAAVGEEPSTLTLTYINNLGTGTAQVMIPAGSLPGASFVIPIAAGGGIATLQSLREAPAPGPGAPAGPDKWQITALLGNFSKLLALLLAERQSLTAQTRDVLDQSRLLTSRGASLDLIGEALAVPRLLPAPYRLDLDPGVIALYHLDDVVGPVVDATGEHPGSSHGATRGAAGKIGGAAQIGATGGITIPSAPEFAIAEGASFTVEMFAQVSSLASGTKSVLAAKRANIARNDSAGWALTVEGVDGTKANVRFSLTDRAGVLVEAVTPQPVALSGWFHVAGVLDAAGHHALLYLNGAVAGSANVGSLQAIANFADIGLGADRTGTAAMVGSLDEVRFSSSARNNFAAVLGGQAYAPDATTIALYHLDENDDWIDEDRGVHYALNHGAVRGAAGRFGAAVRFSGDRLPEALCPSEIEFQRRLKSGSWDRSTGGAVVKVGPYARFGYRQGAIALPGLAATPLQPVMVNDDPSVAARSRGMMTTACYGFVPADLSQTIAQLKQAGRTTQEAIDFFGDWHGEPESFFTQQYQANSITAPHQSCLPVPGTPTSIEIPGSPEFALDVATSFTIEAIIKPDPTLDNYPRAIAASRSSALREGEPNADEAGWALSLDRYGYIPNNLRWTLGDAAGHVVTVTAGLDLGDGSFHHVAGVLDRDAGTALLFVDGVETGKAAIGALGIATGPQAIVLGNDPGFDAPYSGIIDEVRISRVARRSFHPVLGESDARYRRRLALFERYRIPCSETLGRAVAIISQPTNASADEGTKLLLSDGPVPEGQLTLQELDSTRFCATRQFRAMPARLELGQSIDSSAKMPADEADATGAYDFHAEALLRQDDLAGVTFADESCRWMILSAALGLAALAARVHAIAPAAQIAVQKALDATASKLHAEGRSLDVALANAPAGLDLGSLGALAHEIGVPYVALDPAGAFLRLSFAGALALDIAAPATVASGAVVQVSVRRPTVARPTGLTWRLLRCGAGDGTLAPDPASPGGQRFTATAAGQVTITAQYALAGGAYLAGATTLTIAPDALAGCAAMAADGREGVTETEAAGEPDSDFREAYLVRASDPRLDYATENARRMQLPLEQALLRLAGLAAAEPGAPRVTVLAAYDSTASTLQAVGRGLVVAPSDNRMTAARLGALVYRSGFAYIATRHYPPAIYASVATGNRFEIVRSPITRLWPNARISGRGQFMATEFAAAGAPEAGFTTAMLQAYTAAGVTFASGISNQVQASLAGALTALASALAASAVTGSIQIIAGYNPAASDLTKVGRGVLMRHPAVSADRLAGYALQAGFAFVNYRTAAPGGPAVYAAVYASGGAPLNIFTDDDIILDALTELSVRPELQLAGSFDWCVLPCCGAAATLTTSLPDPAASSTYVRKILRATSGGTITIDASFSLNDKAEPYQCILAPGTTGNGAEPRLTKDQYDDLLNFFDACHPVGVEIVTRGIRRFVHGFRRPPDWDQIPTRGTYPRYRTGR